MRCTHTDIKQTLNVSYFLLQSTDAEKTKDTMRAVISKAYQVLNVLKEKTVLKVSHSKKI